METLSTITYEVDARIARITLDRPERGNGITLEMPGELSACVERANLDPHVHALALAGNGSGFCGGFHLVAVGEGETERRGGAVPDAPPGAAEPAAGPVRSALDSAGPAATHAP